MQVGSIRFSGWDGRTRSRPAAGAPDTAAPVTGTAIVPVTPARPRHEAGPRSGLRPDAALIAQLLATRADLPQTREKRRASLAEALASYRTTRHAIDTALAAPTPRLDLTA